MTFTCHSLLLGKPPVHKHGFLLQHLHSAGVQPSAVYFVITYLLAARCMVKIMTFQMHKQELCIKIRHRFSSEQSCSFEMCYTLQNAMWAAFSRFYNSPFSEDYFNNWHHVGMWIFYICNTIRRCVLSVLPVIIALIAISILYSCVT